MPVWVEAWNMSFSEENPVSGEATAECFFGRCQQFRHMVWAEGVRTGSWHGLRECNPYETPKKHSPFCPTDPTPYIIFTTNPR